MRRPVLVAALVVAVAPSLHAQWYSEDRTATVDAAGIRVVRIEAKAGELRVTGRRGVSDVVVRARARANEERYLGDIRMVAERRGDVVRVAADLPDIEWRSAWRNVERALDLVIEIPEGVAVEITDTSGDVELSGTGDVELDDNSGDVTIDGVIGNVRLSDGSGEVVVRDVSGSVTVVDDGSGDLSATDIRGSVLVQEDGSGDITVRRVGGSFTVRSGGSGSIRSYDVQGNVSVPSRYSRSSSATRRTLRL
jgi:DUF4097 and DUF4098 domain-containing protein YvlB